MMAPYFGGVAGSGYSGPMAGPGGQGLAGLLQEVMAHGGTGFSGPAQRHFANQGFDFMPPGLASQNPVGGPNVAPGNIDNGRALDQPQANQSPGVPQGVAMGQQPGRTAPYPHTQGWRNVAPGGAIAAGLGYGTPEFGGHFAPGSPMPPGAMGGGHPEAGGGPGGGGPAAVGTRPVTGGQAPTGGGGHAGGTTGGGGGGSNKQTGGQAPSGVTPQVKQQAAGQSTARGGTGEANMGISTTPGGTIQEQRKNARNSAYKNAQAGSASGSFGDTIHVVPNGGNNNTPSETGGATTGGKLSGLSASEKAARKDAWQAKVAAKQERARVKAAPSASSFGKDPRGTGTEPIAGKTKPKPRSTSGQQR